MRCASEFDYLRDRQIDLGVAVLINGRDPTRDVAAFPVGQRGSVQGHDTGRRTIVPGKQFQQRRFPRTVGAEKPHRTSGCRRDVEVVDYERPADPPTDAGSFECHGLAFRLQRMTANAGTPTSAVTTPAGSSCGAMAVRATASTQTRKMEPISADAGRSRRWFEPTRARAACGRTRPTKPMAPATLTITAVIKAVANNRVTRTRHTFTPSDDAASSPKAKASSARE